MPAPTLLRYGHALHLLEGTMPDFLPLISLIDYLRVSLLLDPRCRLPNTSANSSLTASPPSNPGAPLAYAPATPTTTPTRSPIPIPSMSRNTLQVPEVRLTSPTGEVEMEYLEMVIIFKFIALTVLFQISSSPSSPRLLIIFNSFIVSKVL